METSERKRFEIIEKVEAALDAPILSKLIAYAFYGEFVLKHFYGTSFVDFGSFYALYEFAETIKPVSVALIVVGAFIPRFAGWFTMLALQALVSWLGDFIRKNESKPYWEDYAANRIMPTFVAEPLAEFKRDEYLLRKLQLLREEERNINVTKINVATVFAIVMCSWLYGRNATGLMLPNLAYQVLLLIATGVYAGVSTPYGLQWVRVPMGYTEEEIHPSRMVKTKDDLS